MMPRKHLFWSVLAITIAVCQIQMKLILTSLQNEHDGLGFVQNTQILFMCMFCAYRHPNMLILKRYDC